MATDTNGWPQWSKHVLIEIERLSDKIEGLDDKVDLLRVDVATTRTELRLKAGVWGVLGGAIPIAFGLLIWYLRS